MQELLTACVSILYSSDIQYTNAYLEMCILISVTTLTPVIILSDPASQPDGIAVAPPPSSHSWTEQHKLL